MNNTVAICNMRNKTTDILRGAHRYGVLEDSVAICNMKNKTTDTLRGANQYGVLEDSDKECMNNKVQKVRFGKMRK